MKTTYTMRFWLAAIAILILAAATHLMFISRTPWDWDEPVYSRVASQIGVTGHPSLNIDGEGEWYPYHPPFHFYLLYGWYQIFGTSIEVGRLLSTVIAVAVVAMTMKLVRQMTVDGTTTLLAGLVLATDGWFVYSTLLVKLDSVAILLGLTGLWLFVKNFDRPERPRPLRLGVEVKTPTKESVPLTVAAGLMLGFAACYKHVALVFLVAICLHWLFTRRKHHQHLTVIWIALVVILLYVIFMLIFVGQPYLDASEVQIRRVTGLQEARGLQYGPKEAFEALAKTYWAFGGTLLLLAFNGYATLIQTYRHLRGKWLLVAMTTAWTIAAGMFLAAIRLRNPHYLIFLVVPATVSGVTLLREWWWQGKKAKFVQVFLIVVLLLNVTTFGIRLVSFSATNSLEDTKQDATILPGDAVVLSEEPICALIEQSCFKLGNFQSAGALQELKPDYLIIYTSITQDPPDSPALYELISESEVIRVIQGWKEKIVVLRTPYADDTHR